MSGRVVAAFCFGALSYHVLQSVTFELLEVPEGFNLSVNTGPAGQKSLSPAAAYIANISEESMILRGGDPDRSTTAVEASNNLQIQETSNYEISIANISEDSRAFDSSDLLPVTHIGEVLSVDSPPLVYTTATLLAPAELALQAHIGELVSDIDKDLGQNREVARLGDGLNDIEEL